MKRIVAMLAVTLLATVSVNAAEIAVKGNVKNGDVGLFTLTDIQDSTLSYYYQDGYVPGDPFENAKGAPKTTNNGLSGGSIAAGPEYGNFGIGLIRFDLDSIIPGVTSDKIVSAKLTLYQGGPVGLEQMALYRVTTPWESEGVVTAEKPSATTDWAAGPTVGFGSGDYTTDNAILFNLTPNPLRPDGGNPGYELDFTAMLKDMLDYGNNGFAMMMINATWPYGDAPYIRLSETDNTWDLKHTTNGQRSTELVIEYTPEPATMSLLGLGALAIIRRKRA